MKNLIRQVIEDVLIEPVGGREENEIGTSVDKIMSEMGGATPVKEYCYFTTSTVPK